METLKMHSLDSVQRNIELIGELFPNAITEVKRNGKVEHAIDFDVLRQELSDSIVEGREERYQFTWPDKKKAMLAANAPITATLRPVVADSVGKDGTPGGFDSENLYIEGDNLEVLKLLQETYLGKSTLTRPTTPATICCMMTILHKRVLSIWKIVVNWIKKGTDLLQIQKAMVAFIQTG